MFSTNRIMSDYIVDLADVSAYGCDPMSFEDLRNEFEIFPVVGQDVDGLFDI